MKSSDYHILAQPFNDLIKNGPNKYLVIRLNDLEYEVFMKVLNELKEKK